MTGYPRTHTAAPRSVGRANPYEQDAPECANCGASVFAGQDVCAECESTRADAEADVDSLLAYVEAHADLHPADALLDACDEMCQGTDFDRWLPLYSAARERLSIAPARRAAA